MSSDTDSEVDSNARDESTSGRMTWIDAMEDIFGSAVDRQAEIEMELDDMDVQIPVQLGENPSYADWKLNGTVKFRFDGVSGPFAEWLRYYAQGETPLIPDQESGNDTNTDDRESD